MLETRKSLEDLPVAGEEEEPGGAACCWRGGRAWRSCLLLETRKGLEELKEQLYVEDRMVGVH